MSIIGQENTIKIITKELQACMKTGQMPKSMLFYGEPGLGKSFLTDLVADSAIFKNRIDTYANSLTAQKMKAILRGPAASKGRWVFIIDEIHALELEAGELLYSIMLEGKYNDGWREKDVNLTVLGATTNPELMPRAMFDRFFYKFRLEYYTPLELGKIVYQKHGAALDVEAITAIAARGRGVPRYTLQYADMVLKCAVVKNVKTAGALEASEAFELLGIDELGLNATDRQYIRYLDSQGAPVGLAALSMALSTPQRNLEFLVEPYLLRLGLIQRSSRGRVLGNHPHLQNLLA